MKRPHSVTIGINSEHVIMHSRHKIWFQAIHLKINQHLCKSTGIVFNSHE